MIAKFISIGNSRGVRIPKPLINESGLGDTIELKVKRGEIKIVAPLSKNSGVSTKFLSEKTLSADWNKPEEDAAWKSLQ